MTDDPNLQECKHPGCDRLEEHKTWEVCHKHRGILPSIVREFYVIGRLIEACSYFSRRKIYK
jgi:hypothetical protein